MRCNATDGRAGERASDRASKSGGGGGTGWMTMAECSSLDCLAFALPACLLVLLFDFVCLADFIMTA